MALNAIALSPLAWMPLLNAFASQEFCSVFTQLIYWSPGPGFLTQSAKTEAILYDVSCGHFLHLENKERLILRLTFSS